MSKLNCATLVAAAVLSVAAASPSLAKDAGSLTLNPVSVAVNHEAFGTALPIHLASLRILPPQVVQQQQQQQTARQPEGSSGQMLASLVFADTGFAV